MLMQMAAKEVRWTEIAQLMVKWSWWGRGAWRAYTEEESRTGRLALGEHDSRCFGLIPCMIYMSQNLWKGTDTVVV